MVSPERPKVDQVVPSSSTLRTHSIRTVAPTVGYPTRSCPRYPTHGIAEASHDPDSNPRVSRMVSQKRPKGSVNPRVHVVSQTQKNHGVAGASRSRQRPPQSLLECAAPGRSSQCGTHSGRVQQTPWSHLECAAPGRSSQNGTPAVSTKRKLRPSVL